MKTFKEIREAAGLTLQDVADYLRQKGHLKVSSRTTVWNWEKGRHKPDIFQVSDLSALLGVSQEELLQSFFHTLNDNANNRTCAKLSTFEEGRAV